MKRSTWILLLVLAAAIGIYFWLNSRPETPALPSLPTQTSQPSLLPASGDDLTAIRIFNRQNDIVEVQKSDTGIWNLTLPMPGTADPALLNAAVSQLDSLQVIAAFDVAPDAEATGLLFPTYTIKLSYASGAETTLLVGSLAPTGRGYYVQLEGGGTFIISQAGIDALARLLASPPYLPTDVPTATPEATATPDSALQTGTPTP